MFVRKTLPVTYCLDELSRPWLRKLPNQDKYKCRIHNLRPEVCREFPLDIEQMIQIGCEMLEEGDLELPHAELTIKLAHLNS